MGKEALLYNLEERIAELEEVNTALLSREEDLVALNKIGVEVGPSLNLQEILEKALDIGLSSLGLETGFIFLLNEARGEFVLKAQRGMGGQFTRELITMKAGYDFPAVTPELESLIVVQEISQYPRLGRFLRDREGLHSYISVPLSANGKLLGIMNVFSRGRTPNAQEVNFLVTIAQQIGAAIENAQTFQNVVRAKREWEATFDAITEGIFMLDEEFNILRVNVAFAKMLDTTPAKLIGQKCYRVLHDRDAPPHYCPKIETMETGEPQTIEVREPSLGKDLRLSSHPLRDSRGNVVRTVQIIQDITLRKRLETQLVQAEKLTAIGRLAQGIAHNLLTPLTVIRGRTQLIFDEARDCFEKELPALLSRMGNRESETLSDIAEIYEHMRQELFAIERGSRTMQEIIDNLMYKSRREQEEYQQLVDINDLLWQELKFLDGDPRFKHYIQKAYNFHEGPLYMEGVYSDFSQSFSNLIKNAIDAMEGCEETILTVTTRSDDEYVYIEFRDTGVGIPPENIPHLFEPFFTTKPISGGTLTGTGLGLYSSYQLLRPYGAQFEVKSKPGDTVFTVKMPRQQGRVSCLIPARSQKTSEV
ncbi:MAG: GAF domain-containing protein [Anaerolineales bacterium]|nr:GAF domain-containing protein [Anaerolineales bacterium]